MTPSNLHDQLRELLVYLEFEDLRLLAPYDLDSSEFAALQILHTSDGLRMSDLANRLLVDKSKVTRIVDHLEGRGWVVRISDLSDRRATQVYLTPSGDAHREIIATARTTAMDGRFAALSPVEQTTLGRLLTVLKAHLVTRLAENTTAHTEESP